MIFTFKCRFIFKLIYSFQSEENKCFLMILMRVQHCEENKCLLMILTRVQQTIDKLHQFANAACNDVFWVATYAARTTL